MSLQRLISEGMVREQVPLGPLTTYKSGGPARYLAEVHSVADLEEIFAMEQLKRLPTLIIGRGSNLVVSDRGFPGLVLRLGPEFRTFEFDDEMVIAGGALPLPVLARACVDAGRYGLEFFVGIPGSVGGAVRQNAGCFSQETKDVLVEAVIFDLEDADTTRSSPVDLEMSYRETNLKATQIVISAVFATIEGDLSVAKDRLREITRWRKEHQPGGTLNAGSVFKNPDHIAAGELIDRLGLKGLRRGDVSVSDKHANFFVAGPKATSEDIRSLVSEVKDRVFRETGTMLVPEIQFVGFDEWQ